MAEHQPAFLGSTGAVNPTGGDTRQGPHQNPAVTQGGAPGGPFFTEGELPIESHSGAGMPMTTGGYSASPATAPLPAPGSDTGFPRPPSGNQR